MNMIEQINKYKKVDFRIFAWALGFVFLIFGVVFTVLGQINGRIGEVSIETSKNIKDIGEVKGDIKEINANLDWLKKALIKDGWSEK